MRPTNPVLHTVQLNQAAPDVCNLSTGVRANTLEFKGRRVAARYPHRPPLKVIKPARGDVISPLSFIIDEIYLTSQEKQLKVDLYPKRLISKRK